MVNDPYSVLGLPKDANETTIRERYRQLAKLYHPDLHPDNPAAAQKMNELNEAYEQMRSTSFQPPASVRSSGSQSTANDRAGQQAKSPYAGRSAEDLWEELFRNGEEIPRQRQRVRLSARTVLLRIFLILLISFLFVGFFTNSARRLVSGKFDPSATFNPRAAGYHGLPFSGYQTAPFPEG